MKRRWLQIQGLGLAAVLVLFIALGPSVGAAPLAVGGVWTSGFQVMNVDTIPANVTVSYVPQGGGAPITTPADTIAPGQGKTYFPIGAPAGFLGSAVLESTAQIAAITNLVSSAPNMNASYNGLGTPSTKFSLPLIMRKNGGFSTQVYVQNAGTTPASAQLLFQKTSGAGPASLPVTIASIPVGGQVTVDQGSETDAAMISLGDKWVGSVTVTSTNGQPVAALVTESDNAALQAYSGFSNGAATIFAPLLQNNNGGIITGVQIQNIGATPVGPVTFSAIPTGGVKAPVASWPSIPAGGSVTVFPVTFAGKVGSGVVEGPAGAQLVGIVNQLGPGIQATSYGMFTSGTPRVAAPLLMRENNGLFTGFQVQNVGPSATNVQLMLNGAASGAPVALQPGASFTYFPVPAAAGKFVGAGEVVGPAGSQLVGVVNQLCQGATCAAGDNSSTYEGINIQ